MEISKIEGATRLAEEAIRGHLRGDDPLSVHLAVFSAFRMTSDLREKSGLDRSAIDPLIPEGWRKEFWSLAYSINNFLKHADKDPDSTINVARINGLNEIGLVLVIDNLKALDEGANRNFWLGYFQSKFLVENPGSAEFSGEEGDEAFKALCLLWPTMEHDEVVHMARDPERYAEQFADLAARLQR